MLDARTNAAVVPSTIDPPLPPPQTHIHKHTHHTYTHSSKTTTGFRELALDLVLITDTD